MEKRVYLTILYEYYKNLLNEKHRIYFEDYYFNNLSLAEISENGDISRNAIHKHIKSIETKLESYEEALQLYKKGKELSKIVNSIVNEEIKEKIEELDY